MAVTLPETPMLLKEQCLQYLIDHLEDIPVEVLALLPTAIRHTLAVHLPVADILQLEQTRFASGLGMPGVWKEVCEIRHLLSQYPKLKEMFDSEIEPKKFVMMVVAYEALHHQEKPHKVQAERVYYRQKLKPHDIQAKPPRITGPPVFFSRVCIETSFKVPNCAVPSRFLTMQNNGFDGGVLKLLSTRYDIYLERLYIDCSSCVGVTSLVEVLPRLKQLSISCMVYEEFQLSYLHSLLSGCSQCLHTITLDDCPDEVIEKIASTVVSVFTNSPANFQSLRHFRVTVYRASEKRDYGWCGTYQMGVMREIGCSLTKALTTLCKVIQTHTSLHSCSLGQWSVISATFGSILSLFEQPQFQCLTLTETSFSIEDIQQLIHTFLTTPCNRLQILKLECIKVFGTYHTAPSISDSSFLLHKSLVLDCHISSYSSVQAQSSLKTWLSTICKLELHNVTVTNDYSQ